MIFILLGKQSVDDDIDPITPRDMSSPAKVNIHVQKGLMSVP